MFSLEDNNGKKSAMRISLYWIIGMAVGLTAAIIASIIIMSIKGTEINWEGIALTIGAIGVFIAPAFGFKALQKKYEEEGIINMNNKLNKS